jgi:hypothetical protein
MRHTWEPDMEVDDIFAEFHGEGFYYLDVVSWDRHATKALERAVVMSDLQVSLK